MQTAQKEISYVEAFNSLMKKGKVSLCVRYDKNTDGLRTITDLIRSFDDWNNFRAKHVAAALEFLYDYLPKKDYGPKNPNSGNPLFEEIELIRDTTIILKHFSIEPINMRTQKQISDLVEQFGKGMQADERTFSEEISPTGMSKEGKFFQYYIRFWWD